MCTVTYIPIEDNSFILTHNRDESIRRPLSSPPIKKILGGVKHVYPIDPQGKGTWIGVSETGRMASLLNGGDVRHIPKPPYRHSRGLIIPEYFKYASFEEFYHNFDFEGLEPFTLLVFEHGLIYKVVRNEGNTIILQPDSSLPQLFMSAPLYPQETILERDMEFRRWCYHQKKIVQEEVVKLHKGYLFESTKNVFDPGMEHMLQTISITSIYKSAKKAKIEYYDLVNEIHLGSSLAQKHKLVESI